MVIDEEVFTVELYKCLGQVFLATLNQKDVEALLSDFEHIKMRGEVIRKESEEKGYDFIEVKKDEDLSSYFARLFTYYIMMGDKFREIVNGDAAYQSPYDSIRPSIRKFYGYFKFRFNWKEYDYLDLTSLHNVLTGNEGNGFQEIIAHEARDIARGYHIDEETEKVNRLYDRVLDLYDTEAATVLLVDLIYTQLHEDRIYDIKYDTSRLSSTQIEIIEEYVKLLQARSSSPNNIRLKPFSSQNGSKESLIAVYCTGKDFKGEGHVDVSIPEGELKDYLLRIAGMINIALASSNIPDNLSREEVDKYRPIMSYIKNQYKSILGEELAIPDSPEDILKVIRRIVLGLPKSMRMNTDQIEEFNRLAKEALTAA